MNDPPKDTNGLESNTHQRARDVRKQASNSDAQTGSIPAVDITFSDDTPPLQLQHIRKQYGDVVAIADASLTVEPEDVYCVSGPNGSGKTTLGKIAVGLITPTNGTVTVPTDDIGYGFQSPRFYPGLTVRENISTFKRLASGANDEWVSQLMELLRLDRVAHQPASELSGGFQKKLDLAITFLDVPRYVWLDEPLSDLDDVSVNRIVALLDAYSEAGGAVIVSTHNFEVFENIITHLAVFLDGQQAPVTEFESPPSRTDIHDAYHDTITDLLDSANPEQ